MIPDNDSTPVIETDRLMMQAQTVVETPVAAARGRLMQASVVERDQPAEAPLPRTVAWIRNFLARPHPDVGRPGPVCPFTPTALALDTIWLAEIQDQDVSLERIVELIGVYRDLFGEIEPRTGQVAINKTVLIVFPHLGDDAAAFVDEVQQQLKPSFVDLGLMLGEFHATNESPGLRNPDFRPLRSPVPMLAIRQMVETDLPFLRRSLDTAQVRSQFLRSYLRRLGGTVRRNYFDQAVKGLVEAEIELQAERQSAAAAGTANSASA